MSEELEARLESWDHCYPGNINIERAMTDALAAIRSLRSQLAEKEAEIGRLTTYARAVSKAFTNVSGGGSEMFTRIGDEFYADPKACEERVQEKLEHARRFARTSLTKEGGRG